MIRNVLYRYPSSVLGYACRRSFVIAVLIGETSHVMEQSWIIIVNPKLHDKIHEVVRGSNEFTQAAGFIL